MKKTLIFLMLPVILGCLFNSCKKDNGDPPVLPPSESMIIDFSNFHNGDKSVVSVYGAKGTQTSNWQFVVSVAGIWNDIIGKTLELPIKAFQSAKSNNPSFISDMTWQWSYSVNVNNETYKARLTGAIRTNNVEWEMYITKEGTGGFNEFLWFTGTSKSDGSGGQWIMNLGPQSQIQLLQIDWNRSGSQVDMIKYTYLKTGDPFKNSYIEYGLTTNALNAYYNIHYYNPLILQFFDPVVEWNTTLKNGRVKCPGYFITPDWYCWDGNYLDITCL